MIVEDPTHFISAMQLAVTLSSLALGAVGEPAFSSLVESAFGLSGDARRGVAGDARDHLAFAIITTLHVVLGEIVPKTIGLSRAERVALRSPGRCGSSSASSSRSSGRSSASRAWSTAGSG